MKRGWRSNRNTATKSKGRRRRRKTSWRERWKEDGENKKLTKVENTVPGATSIRRCKEGGKKKGSSRGGRRQREDCGE